MPAPAEGCVWSPGNWVYREARYWWRPGSWVEHRPGWVWVPSHYVWSPAVYVFVDGYWDYPLRSRGLLFAPVCFERPVYAQPGWSFTPQYVVNDDCLLGSLFVPSDVKSVFHEGLLVAASLKAGFELVSVPENSSP